jgi:hypothetical protein
MEPSEDEDRRHLGIADQAAGFPLPFGVVLPGHVLRARPGSSFRWEPGGGSARLASGLACLAAGAFVELWRRVADDSRC